MASLTTSTFPPADDRQLTLSADLKIITLFTVKVRLISHKNTENRSENIMKWLAVYRQTSVCFSSCHFNWQLKHLKNKLPCKSYITFVKQAVSTFK